MLFFANVEVVCPVCHGQRFNETVLNVKYNGRSIKEVLDLTVEEAVEFFAGQTKLIRMLEVLREAGLGYLPLGQPLTTLSGGEAQRLKLAAELIENHGGKNQLYLMDEPDDRSASGGYRTLPEAASALAGCRSYRDCCGTQPAADPGLRLGDRPGAAGRRSRRPADVCRDSAGFKSAGGKRYGPVFITQTALILLFPSDSETAGLAQTAVFLSVMQKASLSIPL